jgi:hypothetical protein
MVSPKEGLKSMGQKGLRKGLRLIGVVFVASGGGVEGQGTHGLIFGRFGKCTKRMLMCPLSLYDMVRIGRIPGWLGFGCVGML